MFLFLKNTAFTILALCSFSLCASSVLSQFIDPLDGKFDASSYLAENAYGFLPVPIIITDPALNGGLGAVGIFFHESQEDAEKRKEAMRHSENAAQHLLPPNVTAVAAGYTGNDSWFSGAGHLGFFNQGKIRYMGGVGYGDINLNFYGFGDLNFNKALELNTQAFAAIQKLKFKIPESNFYIGFNQRYIDASISPTHLPDFGAVFPPHWDKPLEDLFRSLLTSEVTTSGLGVSLQFDNRDNFFSPQSGYSYTLDITRFDDAIGSDIEYDLFDFEGLNYFKINDDFHLGLKLAAEHVATNTLLPPFAMPSMRIRGVPIGRYQGEYAVATEAELNYNIDNRWTLSAFSGIGRVANSVDELKESYSRVGKGVGFRYLIARRYGFKMGLDVAFGPEETVWYVQAGSAW